MREWRWLKSPAPPEDLLAESALHRFSREAREGVDVTVALVVGVLVGVVGTLVGVVWLLLAIPASLLLHSVLAWRRTLIGQRDDARAIVAEQRHRRAAFKAFFAQLQRLSDQLKMEVLDELRNNPAVAGSMYQAWLATARAAFAEAIAAGVPLGGWDRELVEHGPLDDSDYLERRAREMAEKLQNLGRADCPIWDVAFPRVDHPAS